MRLYSRFHLRQRLHREGLPDSDNTLSRYRENKLISDGDFTVAFDGGEHMLYSKERLEQVVEEVRVAKNRRKKRCVVLKCDKWHYAHGFCRQHYMARYYLKEKPEKVT